MKTSESGINLIKEFEGLRLLAYKCPAGVLTIGYGHTGKDVAEDMRISSEQAERFLISDVAVCEDVLSKKFPDIHQFMFDALVSLSFNIGLGWTRKSNLLTFMNNKMYKEAADEILSWRKAGGKILPGLVKRRSAERDLFLQGYHKRLEA